MRDTIAISPGFYLHEPPMKNASGFNVYACAKEAACLGGDVPGNASCAPGHEGVLCGACIPGFYRGKQQCLECSDDLSEEERQARAKKGLGTAVWLAMSRAFHTILLTLALIFLAALHLAQYRPHGGIPRTTRRRDWVAHLAPRLSLRVKALRHALAQRATTANTILRMILGYAQCLGVFRRFTHVHWPVYFGSYVDAMQYYASPLSGIFESVPLECAAGRRISYYYELGITLLLPPVILALLVMLTVVISLFTKPCSRGSRFTRSSRISQATHVSQAFCKALLSWPQLWDLVFWMVRAPLHTRLPHSPPSPPLRPLPLPRLVALHTPSKDEYAGSARRPFRL